MFHRKSIHYDIDTYLIYNRNYDLNHRCLWHCKVRWKVLMKLKMNNHFNLFNLFKIKTKINTTSRSSWRPIVSSWAFTSNFTNQSQITSTLSDIIAWSWVKLFAYTLRTRDFKVVICSTWTITGILATCGAYEILCLRAPIWISVWSKLGETGLQIGSRWLLKLNKKKTIYAKF
jgi:hypothetical protein